MQLFRSLLNKIVRELLIATVNRNNPAELSAFLGSSKMMKSMKLGRHIGKIKIMPHPWNDSIILRKPRNKFVGMATGPKENYFLGRIVFAETFAKLSVAYPGKPGIVHVHTIATFRTLTLMLLHLFTSAVFRIV